MWKVPVFGVVLVRIFPHSDWIQRDAESKCGKVRTRITPNTDTFYAAQLSDGMSLFSWTWRYFDEWIYKFIFQHALKVLKVLEKFDFINKNMNKTVELTSRTPCCYKTTFSSKNTNYQVGIFPCSWMFIVDSRIRYLCEKSVKGVFRTLSNI